MSGYGSPTDRIICPKCGGNNFATQSACWKCGTPLTSAGAPALQPEPPRPGRSGARPVAPPAAASVDAAPPSAGAAGAAVALGFFFPFIAVPVGMIFLMLDGRRRVTLGWIAIVSGTVFTILQIMLTMLMLRPLLDVPLLERLIQMKSTSAPSPNTPVPPLDSPQ